MRSKLVLVWAIVLLTSFVLTGCQQQQEGVTSGQAQMPEAIKQVVQQQAASAVEAIKQSEGMQSVQAKVDYLIGQANNFYNDKQFQQVVDVAQYVLSNLDADSSLAKNLLEKAKQQLQAAAQSAVSDVGQKLGTLGQ